jgi:hypothetical protein
MRWFDQAFTTQAQWRPGLRFRRDLTRFPTHNQICISTWGKFKVVPCFTYEPVCSLTLPWSRIRIKTILHVRDNAINLRCPAATQSITNVGKIAFSIFVLMVLLWTLSGVYQAESGIKNVL